MTGPRAAATNGRAAPARARATGWRAWVCLGALSIVPYLPCLTNGFVFDDDGLIGDNPAVTSPSPAAVWTGPYWPDNPHTGLYRPWTSFTYWRDAHLFGLHAAGFHAVNLLLPLGTTLVLWALLRRLFPARSTLCFAAAALFAIHPLRSEAVAWVVGRSELLAAFWGSLAYLLAVMHAGRRGYSPASAARGGLLAGSSAALLPGPGSRRHR